MNIRMRRSVAIYEVLIGLIAFISAGVSRSETSPQQILLAIVGGALSIAAGALLWQNHYVARRVSVIVQATQVPQISISGIVQYGIALGAAVTPHIGFIPEAFQHAIYSSLRFGNQVTGFYFGVNLLALVALVLVARLKTHDSPQANHSVATA